MKDKSDSSYMSSVNFIETNPVGEISSIFAYGG